MPSKGEYNPTVRSTEKGPLELDSVNQLIERVVMVSYSPLPPVFVVTMPAVEKSPRCQLPAHLMLLMMHIN